MTPLNMSKHALSLLLFLILPLGALSCGNTDSIESPEDARVSKDIQSLLTIEKNHPGEKGALQKQWAGLTAASIYALVKRNEEVLGYTTTRAMVDLTTGSQLESIREFDSVGSLLAGVDPAISSIFFDLQKGSVEARISAQKESTDNYSVGLTSSISVVGKVVLSPGMLSIPCDSTASYEFHGIKYGFSPNLALRISKYDRNYKPTEDAYFLAGSLHKGSDPAHMAIVSAIRINFRFTGKSWDESGRSYPRNDIPGLRWEMDEYFRCDPDVKMLAISDSPPKTATTPISMQ